MKEGGRTELEGEWDGKDHMLLNLYIWNTSAFLPHLNKKFTKNTQLQCVILGAYVLSFAAFPSYFLFQHYVCISFHSLDQFCDLSCDCGGLKSGRVLSILWRSLPDCPQAVLLLDDSGSSICCIGRFDERTKVMLSIGISFISEANVHTGEVVQTLASELQTKTHAWLLYMSQGWGSGYSIPGNG